MSKSHEFLAALLKASEKAANIARVCRQNESLFNLLVQEKTDSEKNPRFFQDFKTLADVLIQESVRHDIGSQVNSPQKIISLYFPFKFILSQLNFEVFYMSYFFSDSFQILQKW